ncbi:transmembrane protein PMIS2 [Oryctolagus cuniculus]|uniref:PMIS2 transmembrane protein n=1 Tax=Oryctolagus cuniculus TaxID=9986 RepID=A0A5F9DM08_RABIT|nr:transmembrane protein PMIS2 [Oryctolagus cuniculus]
MPPKPSTAAPPGDPAAPAAPADQPAPGAQPAPADQPAPGAPPAPGDQPAPGAPPAAAEKKQPSQTKEELAFYAPNYLCMSIFAVLLFFPLGLAACYFSHKTTQANRESKWEEAYLNSGRTGWLSVFGILIGLGIIYGCVLYM